LVDSIFKTKKKTWSIQYKEDEKLAAVPCTSVLLACVAAPETFFFSVPVPAL
jgi:hypothetical protein